LRIIITGITYPLTKNFFFWFLYNTCNSMLTVGFKNANSGASRSATGMLRSKYQRLFRGVHLSSVQNPSDITGHHLIFKTILIIIVGNMAQDTGVPHLLCPGTSPDYQVFAPRKYINKTCD
jgi:hypothetical protein